MGAGDFSGLGIGKEKGDSVDIHLSAFRFAWLGLVGFVETGSRVNSILEDGELELGVSTEY